jgi:methyl coenzyme M reductase subunit D
VAEVPQGEVPQAVRVQAAEVEVRVAQGRLSLTVEPEATVATQLSKVLPKGIRLEAVAVRAAIITRVDMVLNMEVVVAQGRKVLTKKKLGLRDGRAAVLYMVAVVAAWVALPVME